MRRSNKRCEQIHKDSSQNGYGTVRASAYVYECTVLHAVACIRTTTLIIIIIIHLATDILLAECKRPSPHIPYLHRRDRHSSTYSVGRTAHGGPHLPVPPESMVTLVANFVELAGLEVIEEQFVLVR